MTPDPKPYQVVYDAGSGKVQYAFPGGGWIDVPSSGGGGPAGNDTEVQFNNNGAFGSDPSFTFSAGSVIIGSLGASLISISSDSNKISSDGSGDLSLISILFPNGHQIAPIGTDLVITNGDNGAVILVTGATQASLVNSIGLAVTDDLNTFPSGDTSAVLCAQATDRGFLPPVMTTTQKNAIIGPAEGLIVYDSTLHAPCVFTGSAWQTFTVS